MRLPRMSPVEAAMFGAVYARELERRTSVDNAAAEDALEQALWALVCFRQAVRERSDD